MLCVYLNKKKNKQNINQKATRTKHSRIESNGSNIENGNQIRSHLFQRGMKKGKKSREKE